MRKLGIQSQKEERKYSETGQPLSKVQKSFLDQGDSSPSRRQSNLVSSSTPAPLVKEVIYSLPGVKIG